MKQAKSKLLTVVDEYCAVKRILAPEVNLQAMSHAQDAVQSEMLEPPMKKLR